MIEIGGIKMMVPRIHSLFRMVSGEDISSGPIGSGPWNHPLYNCDLKFIPGVKQYVNLTGWSLTDPDHYNGNTQNQLFEILKNKESFREEIDEASGLKVWRGKTSAFYVLPLESAPTADGNPVMLYCGMGTCGASYFLPNKLHLRYRLNISGDDYSNKLFDHDHNIRNTVSRMIKNATDQK